MPGLFSNFGFDNLFDADIFPPWAERIWFSYEEIYLDPNFSSYEKSLEYAEFFWEEASHSYIQEGLAYQFIRACKLYKKRGFKTFKDYCLKRIKKSYRRVLYIIEAAQTAWNLIGSGFMEIPANVSQAYALHEPSKDKDKEYDIDIAWQNVLCVSEEENKPITTRLIESTVNPDKKKRLPKIKLPEDVMDRLREEANESGQKPEDLAAEILKQYFGIEQDSGPETETESEPEPENKSKVRMSQTPEMEPWEIDMQEDVQEYFANKSNYDTTTNSFSIPEVFHPDGDISPGDKSQIRRPET